MQCPVPVRSSRLRCLSPCKQLVLALCLVIGPFQLARAQILTLDLALRTAETRTRHLSAHAAESAAAREMAVAARQLPDPMLRLSLDNIPAAGAESWTLNRDFMTMQSVGVTQTVVREGKRLALAERYEQEALLAETEAVVELAGLWRETALAWFDRHYRERMLVLLREQRAEAEVLIASTEANYRAAQVPQMDVFSARAEAALLDDRIREASVLLENSIMTLERWTGSVARLPLGEVPNFSNTRIQLLSAQELLAQRADSALLAQREAIAESAAKLTQTNRQSDWNVELMFSQRGRAFENMITLGVSVPLQIGRNRKQDREIASSLALLDSVRHQNEELRREYVVQTRRWLETWSGNLERLAAYDTTLLPLERERTEAAMSAYRGNTATLAAVLDARRSALDLRLERLRLEMDTAALWAQLEFLTPIHHAESAPDTRLTPDVGTTFPEN